jgi:hypothetical protein
MFSVTNVNGEESEKKYMEMILAALPSGSIALIVSGVMALGIIGTARSLLREEANAPVTEIPSS